MPTTTQVDVDVFRSLGPKRSAPLGEAPSFFAEGLAKWRELCSAQHWLAAAPQLQQLSQSLPQLLHHAGEVLDILLQVGAAKHGLCCDGTAGCCCCCHRATVARHRRSGLAAGCPS